MSDPHHSKLLFCVYFIIIHTKKSLVTHNISNSSISVTQNVCLAEPPDPMPCYRHRSGSQNTEHYSYDSEIWLQVQRRQNRTIDGLGTRQRTPASVFVIQASPKVSGMPWVSLKCRFQAYSCHQPGGAEQPTQHCGCKTLVKCM